MDVQAQQQQLAAAVAAAVSPTSTQRAEAYTFLEQVRQSRLEVWPACLGLFLSGGEDATTGRWKWTYEQQARVFGLTILDEVLLQCFDQLSPDNVEAIRQGILDYARREYVTGEAEQNSAYAKNKVARTIFCLFLNTYATTWQSFFADFAALVRAQPSQQASTSSTTSLNPKATDLFLRILHEIALEISDTQLRLNKDYNRLNKDTELRDLIRDNAASGLSALIFEVLRDTLAVLGQPAAGPESAAGRTDLVEYAVRAIGDYVSWIDINLVITPHTIPLLFQCLQAPQLNICTAAVEACHETVAKGMPSADKLELIKVLNIKEVCRSLLDAAVTRDLEDPDEIAFRLRLGRLLNTTGMEISKAAADAALDQQRKRGAYAGATELLALALRFLQDADLGICAAVHPFITANLQDFKKQKKISRMPFADDQVAFLGQLLDIVVARMEFPSDADWNGVVDEGGSDDNAPFLELRQSLRILFDAVAFIDDQLFTEKVRPVVTGVLDAVTAGGGAQLTWQRVELVLQILWLWGEADKARGVGVQALVEVSKDESDKAKRNREYKIDYASLPASPLGDLLKRTFTSNIASFPHPAIPLQYFECIVRYHDLFSLAPDSIPFVLTTFCGPQGLHHLDSIVQQRCCYLFSRFIITGKEQIQHHVSVDMTKSILSAISDLLDIKVELTDTSGEDPLSKAAHLPSAFDSQLFLFESAGTLLSQFTSHPAEQTAMLQTVIDRLLADVRANVRTSVTSVADLSAILRLHHAIIAIGSVCRGFPVLHSKYTAASGEWAQVFVRAMGSTLEALTVMSAIAIVREATISSFKVVVNGTGTAVLPLVPTLIESVLDKLKPNEVIDFLPFISLLMHKYKSEFLPLLDAIVHNVFARVYHYLGQPAAGTDDKLQHSELRRAYYSLITNIVNANHQSVFLSERNKPHLESFMKSLIFHCTGEATIADRRAAFGAINRLVNAWVAPLTSPATNGHANETVPGFEQFMYEHVLPICVDGPISKEFDYSDGQSFLLIGEMTTLLKTLYVRRGQEVVACLDGYLKAMAYPSEKAQALLQAIATTADWHDLKKFYAPFCQSLRKERFNAIEAAPGSSAFASGSL